MLLLQGNPIIFDIKMAFKIHAIGTCTCITEPAYIEFNNQRKIFTLFLTMAIPNFRYLLRITKGLVSGQNLYS